MNVLKRDMFRRGNSDKVAMERIRRIIFYIFVAAYGVICPMIILYSFGYIFSPVKEKMVSTGIIYLSTTPPDAHVFLEKSHYRNKTPATIDRLLPGTYSVSVFLSGYHLWRQTVTVEDGKAAAFDKILLIPNVWPVQQLSTEAYQDLTPLPGNEYFLLSKGSQFKDLFVYNWKTARVRPLLSEHVEHRDLRVTEIFSQADSPVLIVSGGALWSPEYYYLRLTAEDTRLKDITRFVSGKPLRMFWSPSDHDNIFMLQRGYIDRLNVASSVLDQRFVDDVRGWGLDRHQLYVISKDNAVLSIGHDKSDLKPVVSRSDLADIFSRERDFYEIDVLDNDTLAFWGQRGCVISNRQGNLFWDNTLAGREYDAAHNRLLVWTRNAIGIVDLSPQEESGPSSGLPSRIKWVFSKGRDIRQCFWAAGDSHVIFRDGDQAFIVELVPQGGAHVDHLTDTRENTSVMYVESRGLLYFLGKDDGKLYALSIMPRPETGRSSAGKHRRAGKGGR